MRKAAKIIKAASKDLIIAGEADIELINDVKTNTIASAVKWSGSKSLTCV